MTMWNFSWSITLLFIVSSANAQIAYEDDLYAITNEILRLVDYPGNAMKDLQRHRNRTDDEMAEELMFVCNALAGNDEMFSARVNAFDYLGDFPSTNTIPFLQTTFKSEENACGIRALVSYIRLLDYSNEGFSVIDSFFDDSTYAGFRLDIYSQLDNQLKYCNPAQETRERIVSFIRLRAGKGDVYGTWLDDILCQHFDGYATSDERHQNLKKLLDDSMMSASTVERAKSRLADMDRPPKPMNTGSDAEKSVLLHEETGAKDMGKSPVFVLETNPASEISPSRNPSSEEKPPRSRFLILVLVLVLLFGLSLPMFLRRFQQSNH